MIRFPQLFLSFFLIILLSATEVFSVQPNTDAVFASGLEYYQDRDFRQAADIFLTLRTPEGYLMAGKSLFALGNFNESVEILRNVRSDAPPFIQQEATYTQALAFLNARSYAKALDLLNDLRENATEPQLAQLSEEKITAYNRFFLPELRLTVARNAESNRIREEVLMYGVRNSSREDGQLFVNEALQLQMAEPFIAALRRNMTYFIDDVHFESQTPDNFVYNIGVLLPQQERGTAPFRVSRELYFGLLMAVNEYNQANERHKFSVLVSNVGKDDEPENGEEVDREKLLRKMFQDLVENQHSDIIYGPLFSDDAEIVAQLANEFNVPVIAPLANAEHLSNSGSYFFQANPTFSIRGQKMADTAVKTLGHTDLAILVDRNSTGAIEAQAFREKAESLGANIVHNFNIDFRQQRFNVSLQTQYFASSMEVVEDTLITLSNVDAVFLPFTGSAANTMIDIVLTDLIAYRSNVDIIGTEDWGLAPLSSAAIRRFNIFYSGIFKRNNSSDAAIDFSERYRNLFSKEPDIFGKNGYDTGNFIMQCLLDAGNPGLVAREIRNQPFFEGIGQNIYFNGGQVNTAVEPRLVTTDGHLPIE